MLEKFADISLVQLCHAAAAAAAADDDDDDERVYFNVA